LPRNSYGCCTNTGHHADAGSDYRDGYRQFARSLQKQEHVSGKLLAIPHVQGRTPAESVAQPYAGAILQIHHPEIRFGERYRRVSQTAVVLCRRRTDGDTELRSAGRYFHTKCRLELQTQLRIEHLQPVHFRAIQYRILAGPVRLQRLQMGTTHRTTEVRSSQKDASI